MCDKRCIPLCIAAFIVVLLVLHFCCSTSCLLPPPTFFLFRSLPRSLPPSLTHFLPHSLPLLPAHLCLQAFSSERDALEKRIASAEAKAAAAEASLQKNQASLQAKAKKETAFVSPFSCYSLACICACIYGCERALSRFCHPLPTAVPSLHYVSLTAAHGTTAHCHLCPLLAADQRAAEATEAGAATRRAGRERSCRLSVVTDCRLARLGCLCLALNVCVCALGRAFVCVCVCVCVCESH